VLTLSSLTCPRGRLSGVTRLGHLASPSAGSHTITWSINDGAQTSAPASSSESVFAPNSDLDITLENTSGQLALWQANGVTLSTSSLLNPTLAPVGRSRHRRFLQRRQPRIFSGKALTARFAVWQDHGGTFLSGNVVADPGPSWQITGTGDFNVDGHTDALFQNDDGWPSGR
jgi:hypothetical protein